MLAAATSSLIEQFKKKLKSPVFYYPILLVNQPYEKAHAKVDSSLNALEA